jgi:Protein of unknown function with HXXEE motif
MNISDQDRDIHPVALWAIVAAIGVHIIEEYAMNFPGWTARFFSMPITPEDFHLVNACVSLYAIACASVGWRLPAFSLSIAGLVGLNGVFHAGASVVAGGYSPGAVTGAVLFLPLAVLTYRSAVRAGVASTRVFVISLSGGMFWHAFLGGIFYIKYFHPLYS